MLAKQWFAREDLRPEILPLLREDLRPEIFFLLVHARPGKSKSSVVTMAVIKKNYICVSWSPRRVAGATEDKPPFQFVLGYF